MRATSSSRNSNTQTCSSACTQATDSTPQARTLVVPGAPDLTPISNNSSITNRLSVTSILSSANNQQTASNSRSKTYDRLATAGSMNKNMVVSTQSSNTPRGSMCVPATRTPNAHRRHNLTETVLGSGLPQTSRSSHMSTSANDLTKVTLASREPSVNAPVQPSFAPLTQTTIVSSVANANTIAQFSQQSTLAPTSFERGFTQQVRPNQVQDNISQLPYSIDALTGNQTSHTRHQGSGTGHLTSFSAESLIGRQQPSNDIVVMNTPVNQPVIQNTFTLTHPTTLTNSSVPSSSAPPQSFSNFSALSLVGSNDAFSVSSSSATQTLPRSTTTVHDTANISQSSNQMFTDFSTESLIGPSEFTSDFAIDNLISRSDSNVHMATVNPNLIQSFGKGNDPMISSVSGDHVNHSSHNFDPPGLNIGGVFSPHLYPTYWS
ncbi:mucin-3A-like isoform X2 [Dendronephthya gigantea]|nr:mucin-3A-like isoform X2 [Dendronephthya gigantea]